MAIGQRYYVPFAFNVNAAGVPYVGGKLYFYETGSSTPQDTYSDVALTTPNANPVIALADGRWPDIWLLTTNAYKVILTDADDVQIWEADPVGPASGGATQNVDGILGEVRAFAGLSGSIPAKWALCYGQAVSRTTYADLFAVIGTSWGAGDGSTTFNLPDLRGRLVAGLDNMGGVAASRITAGVSGVPGTTLGGSGGDQRSQTDTLTAISVVTDPGHTHTVSLNISNTSPTGAALTKFAGVGPAADSLKTSSVATGVTVATTVTSALLGSSQNVQPTAMINWIIYLGV